MEICKKCIIPDSFPNITFHKGVCNICQQDENTPRINKKVLGRDRLKEILVSKKHCDYDCIVPLSGGKDSSFILFYITKELGLNPLAIFFDSGFINDMAKRNVEKLTRKLEVDLVIGKATGFRRKLIKESLNIATILPKTSLKGHLCSNCENNLRTFAINEATNRKIPFIIWGATDYEDSAAAYLSSSKTFKEEYGTFISVIRGIMKNYVLVLLRSGFLNIFKLILPGMRYLYFIARDNIEMKVPEGWKKINPFLEVSFKGKDVETIYFFDYIPYNPHEQVEILQKSLDWESPPDHQMRMDCRLHNFGNYWSLKNKGLTSDGFVLSTLVRNGLLNREDAIRKEEVLKQNLDKDYLQLLEDLSIDIKKQRKLIR